MSEPSHHEGVEGNEDKHDTEPCHCRPECYDEEQEAEGAENLEGTAPQNVEVDAQRRQLLGVIALQIHLVEREKKGELGVIHRALPEREGEVDGIGSKGVGMGVGRAVGYGSHNLSRAGALAGGAAYFEGLLVDEGDESGSHVETDTIHDVEVGVHANRLTGVAEQEEEGEGDAVGERGGGVLEETDNLLEQDRAHEL